MEQIIDKIIPIFLLILFGVFLRYKKWVKEDTIYEIKKGIINISLPCILFRMFRTMQFEKQFIWIVVIFFSMLILFYFIGFILLKIKFFQYHLLPFVVTGFAFGTLGIPLYSSVYGMENLQLLSILGIGHGIFVWFILVTLLKIQLSKQRFSINNIKSFTKSPLIIAIFLGLVFNTSGLNYYLNKSVWFMGIDNTLKYLAELATPLILIVVGYGLVFNKKYMLNSVRLVSIRLTINLIIGYTIKMLVFDKLIHNNFFDSTYFTFLVMPIPYSLPILIEEYGGSEKDRDLLTNTVVLNSLVSVSMFMIYVIFESL